MFILSCSLSGALVFVVLSHGKEGSVYGSDGHLVTIDEIKGHFGYVSLIDAFQCIRPFYALLMPLGGIIGRWALFV